ncbi:hypothetical protein [Streptobacillus notomytis]|uniref:hypothetical protein n=1 Tax=Streptobacillus notomytis TaxID=1712031 RepID=UPI0009357835|nr:hypothetical protein [Streptobacillus notomytis]
MKKLLLILYFSCIISFSVDVTGPRYRAEGSLGTLGFREHKKVSQNKNFLSSSISFLSEWKGQVNEKFDITFGPKITGNFAIYLDKPTMPTIRQSIILGGEVDINYKLKENIKIYTSIEAGAGIGFQIPIIKGDPHVQFEFTSISKIAFGVKLKDKYNVAFYTGHIKGLLGVEAGYTF